MTKKMNAKRPLRATRPRNYAATEATLINIRKLKRDVAALEARLDALEAVSVPPVDVVAPEADPDQPSDMPPDPSVES